MSEVSTNLLIDLESLITPLFLDTAATFLGLLPALMFFLVLFSGFLVKVGEEGGAAGAGGQGRDSFSAFLSSGVR